MLAQPEKSAPAAGSKLGLIIGGIGAVAVAVILVVVLLPGKSPTVVPPGGTDPARVADPGTKPPPNTPVPVHVTEPGKPATTPAAVATTPTKTEPVAVKNNDPEPDDADEPDTSSKPGKGDPNEKAQRKAARAARLAAKVAAKTAKAEADTQAAQPPLKTLTADAQRQNMLKAESRFKACAKEAFGSYVTISVAVDNSGTVQKADLIGPLGTSATGRCISDQIRKQHFPPFTEGPTKQFVWSYQIPSAP